MTSEIAPPSRKRGRPPLPADNETREAILNAAQQLFAERSFTQVSVREITDAAGLGIAAINYHFGNKEGLVRALFRRIAPELIDERRRLLAAAVAVEGDATERVRAILYALVAPVIRWSALPETQALKVPFVARMRLDGPADLREMALADTGHLKRFVRALQQALPHLPPREIFWRLHFVLGIEHSLHLEARRLESLSGGQCTLSDPEEATQRLIDFALPGVLAPVVRQGAAAGRHAGHGAAR